MTTDPRIVYEFGPFCMDPDKQVLLRENQPIPVTPKAFETLLALVRHSRDVVTKEELLKEVWPDSFVEESNLSQNIFMLRKALGDTAENRQYIVTLPGRGYRFAASVRTVTQQGEVLVAHTRARAQIVIEENEAETDQALKTLLVPQEPRVSRKFLLSMAGVAALLALGAFFLIRSRVPANLSEKDSILAADFVNTTGDPVFDDTLHQGMTVQLEQSPFLSLVSDERIQKTLALMEQPADTRLTPAVGREICQRVGSTAVLNGSIARLGSQYVLGLRAVECRTGYVLDAEQARAARKEDVLTALSEIAGRFRTHVGESLSTVGAHNTPLEEATTPSLDALKAYSLAWKVSTSVGNTAAIPLMKRAIEIDPQFAMAHAMLSKYYFDIGELALSRESARQAFELRKRASDRERFFITTFYEMVVTGDLEKAEQICDAWAQTYPRDVESHAFLSGMILVVLGRYEKAVEEGKRSVQADPDAGFTYNNLALAYVSLGRIPDGENTLVLASERKIEIPDYMVDRYQIAFLKSDAAEMDRIAALATEVPGAEDTVSDQQAFALAYSGRLQQARAMSRRAVEVAQQTGQLERAALFEAGSAVREGFFGDAAVAKRGATAALMLSKGRDAQYGAAFALALAGDSKQARTLADDLENRFPEDTNVRYNYVPALRALLALNQGDPAKGIELLHVNLPYDLGEPVCSYLGFYGLLYPIYVRGEAYMALHQGAQAAAEFQKILDHPGIVISDPVGALARLQLGRAYAMSGDTVKAKAAYQNFLTLWKDADPGIPILKRAKAEFSNLR